jgi:hypothetical protein
MLSGAVSGAGSSRAALVDAGPAHSSPPYGIAVA